MQTDALLIADDADHVVNYYLLLASRARGSRPQTALQVPSTYGRYDATHTRANRRGPRPSYWL
eukprot:440498-Prymnesium_polylepis.1